MDKQRLIAERGRMQFITHHTERYSYLDSVKIALEGGCRWIQLRMKEASVEEVRDMAMQVSRMCHRCGAVFIIDDHVELCRETDADGVHLGKNDMPIAEARRLLGEGFIIGGTANTYEDLERHVHAGADYIGCGPFRYTTTKQNLSPLLGLEGYDALVRQMRTNGLQIPVVAIGGITTADVPDILKTGVSGIAVSGSVLRAAHPVEEMHRFISFGVGTEKASLRSGEENQR